MDSRTSTDSRVPQIATMPDSLRDARRIAAAARELDAERLDLVVHHARADASSSAASFCTQFDIFSASISACRSISSSAMPVGGILTTGLPIARRRRRSTARRAAGRRSVISASFGQQHRALDRVLELADVARPVVAHQQLLRVGRRARRPSSSARRRSGAGRTCASGTMSSLRSRSGGISIETTFRR